MSDQASTIGVELAANHCPAKTGAASLAQWASNAAGNRPKPPLEQAVEDAAVVAGPAKAARFGRCLNGCSGPAPQDAMCRPFEATGKPAPSPEGLSDCGLRQRGRAPAPIDVAMATREHRLRPESVRRASGHGVAPRVHGPSAVTPEIPAPTQPRPFRYRRCALGRWQGRR